MQDLVWFHHKRVKDSDEYVKLCSVRRFLKLTSEGDPELFFEAVEAGAQEPQEDEQQPAALMAILERAADGRFIGNDKYEARHIVQHIDDDNKPAPENLPGGVNDTNRVLMQSLVTTASAIGRKREQRMLPFDLISSEGMPRRSRLCHPSFSFLNVSL